MSTQTSEQNYDDDNYGSYDDDEDYSEENYSSEDEEGTSAFERLGLIEKEEDEEDGDEEEELKRAFKGAGLTKTENKPGTVFVNIPQMVTPVLVQPSQQTVQTFPSIVKVQPGDIPGSKQIKNQPIPVMSVIPGQPKESISTVRFKKKAQPVQPTQQVLISQLPGTTPTVIQQEHIKVNYRVQDPGEIEDKYRFRLANFDFLKSRGINDQESDVWARIRTNVNFDGTTYPPEFMDGLKKLFG